MATTTPNFGFDIPQSTDLVKDGATAIAALGTDIDTAFVDLKGGTTGQVLAKASNTDLDYSWVTQDDANAIQNAIVDAKGDLIAATANDTPARLAVGTNGQLLSADSAEATGLKWINAPSSASGLTLIKTQTIGTGVSSVTVTNAFSTTYENYMIILSGGVGNANTGVSMKLGSTSTGYYRAGFYQQYGSGTLTGTTSTNDSSYQIATTGSNGYGCVAQVLQPFATKRTTIFADNTQLDTSGYINISYGFLNDTTSYTDFTLSATSLTGGTIKVYGYQTS
jgi:hypothetical protein